MIRSFWLIMACFTFAGCSSTVPKGDTAEITITTKPLSANLKICNGRTGQCQKTVKTPYAMSLNRSQDLYWPAHYIISCNKDGFKEVTRTLHVGIDGWYLLIVDRETEANVEVIELEKYTVELELPKEQIIDPTTEEVANKMIL